MRIVKMSLVIIALSSVAFGAVGWCGNIWPNSDTDQPIGDPIYVYFQIWKDGVTDSVGRGDSIAATLYWKEAGAATWNEAEMGYLDDVGNNDEYNAAIPAPTATGDIEYYCEALDSTDMTTATGTDQNSVALNESAPGVLHIVDVTAIDVAVTFQVDMSMEDVVGAVTVGGSFNAWSGDADTLTDPDMDDVYTLSKLFPAGSSPSQEYKFVNGGTWESRGNRAFTIDDSSPTQVIPVVYFDDRDPADYTTSEVTVSFSVDMSGETVTSPYVAGSVFPLRWGWDAGWSDSLILFDDGAHGDGSAADDVYGAQVVFPIGSYRDVEYKYSTDGTDNEPLPAFENHAFSLGDSPSQILPIDTFGVLTGIDEPDRPLDLDISISPNPFNSAVSIDVRLPAETNLDVSIHDIGGRRVSTLFDGHAPMGEMNLTWRAELPSGIYLLRVDTPRQTRVEKLFLVR